MKILQHILKCFLTVILFSAFTPSASAQLAIDADYDHGSLLSWSGTLSSINLGGRDNFYGENRWRWLYFNASGINGATPTFRINSNFAGGSNALSNHRMVYSYDNEHWSFFDNNQLGGGLFTFSNNSAFTQDSVYVAYAQAYSYGRSAAHVQTMLATPWAEPTASGDASGVIGMSPGGTDDLGRTVSPRALYSYRISNFATDSAQPKRKVVLTSGLHAGEVLGTHTLEGLTNWLVSDDVRAARLRDVAEFFVYPVLNPDGRFAGNSRATVENPNEDPNRIWNATLYATHQDIRVSGEAMIADVQATPGSTVDAFIDFHSTIPSSPGDDFGFIEVEQGDNLADFWVALRQLQPNILEVDSTSTGWTSANFAEAFLNAEVDITFETQFGQSRPISYYHTMGENFGIAFYNAWVQVENPEMGDFDEDGDVDADDFAAWQSGFGTSSNATHFTGDADSDGDVDGDDFLTWQTQYGNGTNTATNNASLQNQVPEPISLIVMLIVVLGLVLAAVRRR